LRPENLAPSRSWLVLALATSGRLAEAERAVADLGAIASVTGEPERELHQEMLAVIASLRGNLVAARQHIAQAGSDALIGRAILAEALLKAGRTEEARTLASQVIAAPFPSQLNAIYAIAVLKSRAITRGNEAAPSHPQ
jgi:hypothetical protein